MKKALIIIMTLIVVISSVFITIKMKNSVNRESTTLQNSMYNFLKGKYNRISVYNSAAKLHGGKTANTCVFFVAEALRRNKVQIPTSMGNTGKLISYLKSEGWKKSTDYKKLVKGDLCFTTGENLDKHKTPTHTYIFMGWVNEGKYDYAYICDNQAKDYKNMIYHVRNITVKTYVKGKLKDPFNFFMYK